MSEFYNTLLRLKESLEDESFESTTFLFGRLHLLHSQSAYYNKELNNLLLEFEEKVNHYTKDISSQLRKSYVKDYYGRVFRKLIELICLSDASKLNI